MDSSLRNKLKSPRTDVQDNNKMEEMMMSTLMISFSLVILKDVVQLASLPVAIRTSENT